MVTEWEQERAEGAVDEQKMTNQGLLPFPWPNPLSSERLGRSRRTHVRSHPSSTFRRRVRMRPKKYHTHRLTLVLN